VDVRGQWSNPPTVTFVKPLQPAFSHDSAEPERYRSRARNASESEHSDEAEAESPQRAHSRDGFDDDEYQFSFDHEAKDAAPVATTRHKNTSWNNSVPAPPEPLTMRLEDVDAAAEAFRLHAGPPSESFTKFSQQTFAFTDDDREEKPPPGLHFLRVFHALYGPERKLLYAYSVGPLSRRLDGMPTAGTTLPPQSLTPTAVSSAVSHTSAKDGRGRLKGKPTQSLAQQGFARTAAPVPALTQPEAYERAATCRHNAAVVQQLLPEEKGLSQFWNLLAVVLDMLTITDSGCLIGWHQCTIGLALLHRLYSFLCERADLQTFATALCVLGGSDILVDLLSPYYAKPRPEGGVVEEKRSGKSTSGGGSDKKDTKDGAAATFDSARTKKYLEAVLYSYADVLNRWGEQLSSVEVSHTFASPLCSFDEPR
jgi:hypothetical protein